MEIIRFVSRYYVDRFLARDIDIHLLLGNSSHNRPPESVLVDKNSEILEIKIIIPELYLDLRKLDNKNLQEIEGLKKQLEITKEKIIKVLDKNIAIHPYYKEHNMEYAHQNYLKQIASEILGDDNDNRKS